MALGCCLEQGVKDASLDTVIRIRHDTHLAGNVVGHFKAHTRNVVRQAVRILLDDPIHPVAVLFVDLG